MESSKVSTNITYRKPGTQPPVYIAGTFSSPPWEPHEMAYTTDEDGEHVFTKKVTAEPGAKIQYKFRLGTGDWWVLHDNVPTVADSAGNLNHELVVPQHQGLFNLSSMTSKSASSKEDSNGGMVSPRTTRPKTGGLPPVDKAEGGAKPTLAPRSGTSTPTYASAAAEVADTAALLNKEKPETPIPDEVAGKIGYRRLSSTPIVEVANTAAEVADTARDLDEADEAEEVVGFKIIPVRDDPRERDDLLDDGDDETADNKAPLFSHECIGMHDNDEEPQETETAERGRHDPGIPMEENGIVDDTDLNDPTLERFPSNREEIIDAVRRLGTGLDEDQAVFDGVALSPVVGTPPRRGTEDPVSDVLLSAMPVCPVLPRAAGRLGMPRSPRSSVVSTHSSAASLQAIAESDEPDQAEETKPSPVVLRSTSEAHSPLQPPGSEEDECVVLKDHATSITTKGKGAGVPTPDTTPSPERSASHSQSRYSPEIHGGDGRTARGLDGDSRRDMPDSTALNNNQNRSPQQVIETAEEVEATCGEPVQQEVAGGSNGYAGEASATGVTEDSGSGQLRRRKDAPDEQCADAAVASGPPAPRPPEQPDGWFMAFFRLIFVDWFGGFISRLCGVRRKT